MPNVIYGLHEAGADEIRYVGKTCDLSRRLGEHRHSEARHSNRAFHDWLLSVKVAEVLCAKVLEESPVDWIASEGAWVRRLRREGHRLLNSHPGGGGGVQGAAVSEESRARMSSARKLLWQNLEYRAKISAFQKSRTRSSAARARLLAVMTSKKSAEHQAGVSVALKDRPSLLLRGRVKSPEHRASLSAALKGKNRGKVRSPEHVARMSAAMRGKIRSPEHCARLSAVLKGKSKPSGFGAMVSANLKGKKLCPEHRAKISLGLKAAYNRS